MVEEAPREAHIPTQQPTPCQEARLPSPHGQRGGTQRPAVSSPQGPQAPVGLIWRIRDRRTFVDLRRRGRRARHGSVSVTYLPATAPTAADPPRIAFAVPRKVGTAVVRNRLRRQVRAHLTIAAAAHAPLEPGAYLVALRPGAGDLGRDRLLGELDRCLDRLTGASR
jgi:ribonuclease P protein component